ncbi:MAG: acyl carrier protein [Puniceicoccales bacterium]
MAKIDPSEFLDAIADAIDGVEKDDLLLSMNLKDIPNWDSLAKLSVVAELEERFEADLGLADLAQCETLGDLHQRVAG